MTLAEEIARAREGALYDGMDFDDGTGAKHTSWEENNAGVELRRRMAAGSPTWDQLLRLQVARTRAQGADTAELRAELVGLIALASEWVEAIDERDGEL